MRLKSYLIRTNIYLPGIQLKRDVTIYLQIIIQNSGLLIEKIRKSQTLFFTLKKLFSLNFRLTTIFEKRTILYIPRSNQVFPGKIIKFK